MFDSNVLDALNSREEALIIWVAIGLGFGLHKIPALRPSLVQVVRALLAPRLLALWITVAAYTAAIVVVGERLEWWHPASAKETVYWYFGTGLVFAGRATQTRGDPAEFKRVLRQALKLTLVLEFFINFWVFPLGVELVFIPIVVLLVTMNVVAERETRLATANRLLERVLVLIGSAVVLFVAASAATSVDVVFSRDTMEQLLVAPGLTVAAIPLFYFVALLTTYELAFMHADLSFKDRQLARTAKWEIARTCRMNLRRVGRFDGQFFARARGVADAAEVTKLVREVESGREAA